MLNDIKGLDIQTWVPSGFEEKVEITIKQKKILETLGMGTIFYHYLLLYPEYCA